MAHLWVSSFPPPKSSENAGVNWAVVLRVNNPASRVRIEMIKVVLQESPLKPQGIRIVLKGVGRWTGMLASTYTHCKAGINLKLGHIPPPLQPVENPCSRTPGLRSPAAGRP